MSQNTPNFEVIIQRLKKEINANSDRDLADFLGMTPGAFANRKSSGSIPYEEIVKSLTSRDMGVDWLFSGEGEPRRTEGESAPMPDAFLRTDVLIEIMVEQERSKMRKGEAKKGQNGHYDHSVLQAATSAILGAAHLYNEVSRIKGRAEKTAYIKDRIKEQESANTLVNSIENS